MKSRQLETHKQRLPRNSRATTAQWQSLPARARAVAVATAMVAVATAGSHCHPSSFLSCAEFLICLANIERKRQHQLSRSESAGASATFDEGHPHVNQQQQEQHLQLQSKVKCSAVAAARVCYKLKYYTQLALHVCVYVSVRVCGRCCDCVLWLWLLVHFSPVKCDRFVWTDTSKSHLHYSSAACCTLNLITFNFNCYKRTVCNY